MIVTGYKDQFRLRAHWATATVKATSLAFGCCCFYGGIPIKQRQHRNKFSHSLLQLFSVNAPEKIRWECMIIVVCHMCITHTTLCILNDTLPYVPCKNCKDSFSLTISARSLYFTCCLSLASSNVRCARSSINNSYGWQRSCISQLYTLGPA